MSQVSLERELNLCTVHSTILDRTLQHNATVTWGTNGSFEYTVTDVLYNTTVLSYSAKGYMGDQSSLKVSLDLVHLISTMN